MRRSMSAAAQTAAGQRDAGGRRRRPGAEEPLRSRRGTFELATRSDESLVLAAGMADPVAAGGDATSVANEPPGEIEEILHRCLPGPLIDVRGLIPQFPGLSSIIPRIICTPSGQPATLRS